jgi:SSS family solute:Na+ symporter
VADKVCFPGLFGFVLAALTAALMSTIDTLINAVSAVSVNDIYKPYIMKKASDKHYLRVARIISLSSAAIGIALVPLFASFKSIYVAHGSFTAAITPPMVVAILLGAFWKRYTPAAAFATLLGGAFMVAVSIAWPVVIEPFSHGIDPAGGFKYIRSLYGIAVSGIIAIVVTFFTKPKPKELLDGLIVGTMNRAKEKYKGAPVNEDEGEDVVGELEVINRPERTLVVSAPYAEQMKAKEGDLIYVSDARRWLGGLRSIHAKLTGLHQDADEVIYVSPDLVAEGELIAHRKHRMEKIF